MKVIMWDYKLTRWRKVTGQKFKDILIPSLGDPQYATRRVRDQEEDGEEDRQRQKRPAVVDAWDPRAIRRGIPDFQPREPIRRPTRIRPVIGQRK